MWFYLLLFIVALFAYFYKFMTKEYGYFKSQGFAESPASFPIGSAPLWGLFTGKENFFTALTTLYYDFKSQPIFGYYFFGKGVAIVRDLDLAKQIMIKDFDYFMDRRPIETNQDNYSNKVFSEMLTALEGDKWKSVRGMLSPVFTSGKLKAMAPMINKVGIYPNFALFKANPS